MNTGLEFGVLQSPPGRRAILHDLVLGFGREEAHVLEIGSYEGGSAVHWSEAIAKHCPKGGSVLCVDPWLPYLGGEAGEGGIGTRMDLDLASGAVFERFKANAKMASPKAPIHWLVGTLAHALPNLPREFFDIVYIDGAHNYAAVQEDLELGSRLLHPWGLLCGDDLEAQAPDCTPESLTQDVEYNGGFHPGVTRAVWEFFKRRIWSMDGVWACYRVNGSWTDFPGGTI